MTDSNPFSKFWDATQWKIELRQWTGTDTTFFEKKFKEFAELCEQERNNAKDHAEPCRNLDREDFLTCYHFFAGQADAFRLVKPQILTTTKTVKISNSKKGLRAVSGQPQLTDTSMSNRKCAQPVGAKPTNPKHKHN